jgi:uncharacterized protein YdbL (DUF1318 family)
MRCGKERVTRKTWTEVVGTSTLTYTTAECPDAACQAVVDEINAQQAAKRQSIVDRMAISQNNRHKRFPPMSATKSSGHK